MAETAGAKGRGWLGRLRAGLSRSANALGGGIGKLLTRRRIDDGTLQELEDLLVSADLGVATAQAVTQQLAATHRGKEADADDVRRALAAEIARILEPLALPIVLDANRTPHVILVAGVNGTGKTTTIGKLAHRFREDGKQVVLAAADTFRAAAIDQLRIWGERAGAQVVAGPAGGDAAGLAFEALQRARATGADVLLIDTAGRLQNQAGLMAELAKITRVIKKIDDSAPHSTLLVLDATTGQNAHSQVELFREACPITGLVMTKLDGTARGGILVALGTRFGLPINAIGVGEAIEDLQPFDAASFAAALVGLSP